MQKIIALLALCLVLGCSKEKDSDPCTGVVCANGGTCINGICNCAGLWTGDDCTDQRLPLLLTIKGILLNEFPATDAGGSGWDLTNGPDVYVVVKQNGNVIATTKSSWVQNATSSAFWNIQFSTNQALTDVVLEVWDYDDFDSDDFMGAITGRLYSETGGYPDYAFGSCTGCTIKVRFGPIEYL